MVNTDQVQDKESPCMLEKEESSLCVTAKGIHYSKMFFKLLPYITCW